MCGADESLLFGRRDAFQRTAETGVLPETHFDEDQCILIAHDEVDLTARCAEVAFQQDQPLLLEVSSSVSFNDKAPRMGGAF